MKIYTLEIERAYEEDFGSFQYHMVLVGVYGSREEAIKAANSQYQDNRIREWTI